MFSVTIREKSGQVYTFHFDKPEIMIGRVKGNDVILPKQNISKRHALVRVHGPRFVVEDLGSTNGTYVNGHRITTPVEVGSEDKAYLGDFVMQFFDLGQPNDGTAADDAAPLGDDLGLDAATSESGRAVSSSSQPAQSADGGADFDASGFGADEFSADAFGDDAFGDDAFAAEAFDAASADDALASGAFGADDPFAAPVADQGGPGLDGEADAPLEALDALDESTLSQLGDAASDAMAEIAARREAAAPMVGDAAVVAADPVAAMEAVDDRMTGPVDGLGAALDAAAAAVSGVQAPDLSLDLSMPDVAAPMPVMSTAEGDAFVPPSGHYDALALLHTQASEELAGSFTGDAAQLSDSEWAEMEARVVAFVDGQHASLPDTLDLDRLKRDLIYELVGLGPLETLLDDAAVETIEVNGPEQIWVHRDSERQETEVRFSGQAALSSAAERLVRASGAPDSAGHWVDGTLADGTTVRVAWPPLCPNGPVVLIRKPRGDAPSLDDLVGRGVVTEDAAGQLRDLMLAGRSIALVGAAGSGRRTVLNALAREVPDTERIVVTEQGVRLHLSQPQVIRLDTAVGDEALHVARMLRPDRILLGECGAAQLIGLIDHACDGIAPWLGFLHARSAEEAMQRALNAHAVRYAGVPMAVAASRTVAALDVLGVFSIVDGGAVLDRIVEVTLEGADLRAVDLKA